MPKLDDMADPTLSHWRRAAALAEQADQIAAGIEESPWSSKQFLCAHVHALAALGQLHAQLAAMERPSRN